MEEVTIIYIYAWHAKYQVYYEDLVIDVEDIEAKGKGQLKFENGMYSFKEQVAE